MTSQVRIPAQKQPCEVGESRASMRNGWEGPEREDFYMPTQNPVTQGMFRWPSPGSRTPQSRAQHRFLAGLNAKHFEFTEIQQKGEFI